MKHLRMRTAMAAVLWVGLAWSPARAVVQCCDDCDGNGTVTIHGDHQ